MLSTPVDTDSVSEAVMGRAAASGGAADTSCMGAAAAVPNALQVEHQGHEQSMSHQVTHRRAVAQGVLVDVEAGGAGRPASAAQSPAM